ncbi:alpha/beta hydrolase [Dactylosporangium sp. NPDC050688]|uniref:alpha/beta fold hydrolase n=1 Tax=Dactylosporangium sp. NPDC050688 TaxID=3157217 RepID=UPI0033C6D9F3
MPEQRSRLEVRTGTRVLTYQVAGPDDGLPVFLLHGTPGSSSGPRPRNIVLHRLGIRLISYDRPGYNGSTRLPDRRVADAADDVGILVKHLGLHRYGVVGRSGGGPHALAVAAQRPDEVIAAAVLVSVAPADAPDLDWFGGMADSNVEAYTIADASPTTLAERIRLRAERIRRDPESLIEVLRDELRDPDRRIVDDTSIRRLLAETYAEALRLGADGWIDDALALRGNWGFDLGDITAPVRLWHGEDDNFSPVSHTRWLARQLARCEVQVQPGAAHFGAMEILPQMLDWLKSRTAPA